VEPPHKNSEYLHIFHAVKDGHDRDPTHIMKAIAVCMSCASSGHCVESDRHATQINRFFNMLVDKENQ
jgi:phosphoribosylpyrophosphate synthetase